MVFRAGLRDPFTRDVSRLSESVKKLESPGEKHPNSTLSESRETSQVHGSRYPARKNGNCFIK